ncbi:MAG: ABC transporter ATP-binding protein [Lachnospiraceae bacterium]|nr:ABC transporter ATP-binding protein [Lachnospiraceae bacterium]
MGRPGGPKGQTAEPMAPERRRHTLLRLMRFLMEYRMGFAVALILSVGGNLFALIGPQLSGQAIDVIEKGLAAGKVEIGEVFTVCMWMLLFYLLSSVLGYILSAWMIRISKRISLRLRKDVFDRLLSLPVSYFDQHATGDIISKISYDIDTLNSGISQDLVAIFSSVITVAGSLISMVMISPKLVLVFAVTVPVSMVMTKKITSMTRPLFRRRSRKLGELNAMSEELITGQKTLKAYHQEENTRARYADMNRDAVEAYYQADYYGAMVGPFVNFMNNLSMTLVSVLGALMYLHGEISLGQISAFVLYSRKFSGPINEVANIMGELQSALAAAERVFQLLDEAPETEDSPDALALDEAEGRVSLTDVSFGYQPEKRILHHLNLDVRPGSQIAIVGPTGAGKTTLINLLMRFYDTDEGTIAVDGHDIRQMTRESLRRQYAMVLQDTWLFEGTIYENIAYGKTGATREDVERAARMAGIHSYIMQLPQGYDTVLTDEGTNISKGQKQLLTIARAILLNARMLILDEATSNVDTRTEQRIQKAMTTLMKGKTCFIIAHRLSTIVHADQILVVKDGNIVETGTHKELLAQNGFYKQLYEAQYS